MSSAYPFFNPVFRGGRFDHHALPLEFLKDLTVLEEMLTEIAKCEFKLANMDRQRIPRNFGKGLELCVNGIGEGSTTLNIVFMLSSAASLSALNNPNHVYYERAKDKLINAVAAANAGESVKDFIPNSAVYYLEQFGRGLRDDESIELSGSEERKSTFTNKARKTILSEFKRSEFEEECVIRGFVPEMNQDTKSCQLILCHDDSKITINYERYESEVRAAFDSYLQKRSAIQITGTGTFSVQDNRLQKIKSVQGILFLAPLDVSVQTDELKKLRDGWLNGDGKAPEHRSLDWFVRTWDKFWVEPLPLPYIYPTEDGGIILEWSTDKMALSLDVDLMSQSGYWHALNIENGQAVDREIKLEESDDWKFLIEQIEQQINV